METGALKKFAQEARQQLLEQVAARMEQILQVDSVEIREKAAAVEQLREQIAESSKEAVIDRVAYTWFNRFCALRYMDANHYTRMGIVSPQEGFTQPEILAEAKQGVIDDSFKVDQTQIIGLLNGQIPAANPQQEAYQLLLVGVCSAYHAQMPFLFPEIEDYTALLMPEDLLSEDSILQAVRTALDEAACQDVEVIGWLYQYYIAERKDEVFAALKKRKKIESEDIPAATQLFTPHWIVRYLVENSLGRLWMLNNPNSRLIEQMEYYIQPEEPETDILRVDSPEELKICDPACGSGHMLTYAFDLLYAIYEEMGYDPVEIPQLILEKNLYGIEIDQRAGHLAAFALTMKARDRDRRFFTRKVEPNICVLRNVSFFASEIDEYMQAVGRDLFTQDLWLTLRQFEQAENFGSLIRPALNDVGFIRERLEEKSVFGNMFLFNTNQKVEQVLEMAEYLNPRYHVVVANPPYMGNGGMNTDLKEYSEDFYPETKTDLGVMFIERNLDLLQHLGIMGMITMHSWMFISSYKKLRKKLITKEQILSMAHLGARAFDTIGGEVVSTSSFVLRRSTKQRSIGMFVRLVDRKNEAEKEQQFLQNIKGFNSGRDVSHTYSIVLEDLLKIPGSPIAYWIKHLEIFDHDKIGDIFFSGGRLKTHNGPKYIRYIWEVSRNNNLWKRIIKGGEYRKYFGHEIFVADWSKEAVLFYQEKGGLPPKQYTEKKGVCWTKVSSSKSGFRIKSVYTEYDAASPTIFNDRDEDYYGLLGYLNSPVAKYLLSSINPTINTQLADVFALPIIYVDNPNFENRVEQLISFAKIDWDSFEISWDFSIHPILAVDNRSDILSNSYNSVRDQWQVLTNEAKRLESDNNRTIIESYGMTNEISPNVSWENITLTCNPVYRYPDTSRKAYTGEEREALLLVDTMKEFISYAVGCMFGRYSLDKPGLILVNQGETLRDYLAQVPEPSFPADDDNVIPVLDEGWFDDDIVERFKRFLRVTFGDEYYEENLAFLENAIGKDIRSYFLRDFYNEHVKMYKKRPIYWLFSSPKGSFNALIYMHRYRPDTVSIILNDYLREYREKISAQKVHLQAVERNPSASQGEKTKALREIDKIDKVLAELREYEDEILYPLATQQVQIDLDDGVKANYPKFGKALKKVAGLSG